MVSVPIICFVGADTSGKTEAHKLLSQEPEFSGLVEWSSGEAATILIAELGCKPPFVGERLHAFQQAVYGKTLVLERAAQRKAFLRPGVVAVLRDRGAADALGYLGGDHALLEKLLGITHEEALSRYAGAIFFDPPDEATFERVKPLNPGRIDRTYAETIALSEATFATWASHPYIRRVPTFARWEDKLEVVRGHLRELLAELAPII